MADVAIVGAGLMGTATAYPLSDNGHRVRLVGTHQDGEIIQRCKAEHYHPTLKRKLPEGVRPYFIDEIAEAELPGRDPLQRSQKAGVRHSILKRSVEMC